MPWCLQQMGVQWNGRNSVLLGGNNQNELWFALLGEIHCAQHDEMQHQQSWQFTQIGM